MAKKKAKVAEKTEKVEKSETKKHGFFYRLFHNKWFLGILIVAFGLFCLGAILFALYEPPFPPNWIGIKYYSYDVKDNITIEDISKIEEKLKVVQTAMLVIEPTNPEAKRILPDKVIVKVTNLGDPEIISLSINSTLASYLSGIQETDSLIASQILSNPTNYLTVKKVYLAVTQVNNLNPDEMLFVEELAVKGKEVPHEEWDEAQESLVLAKEIKPITEISGEPANKVTIEKRQVYRIYENEEAKKATAGARLKEKYGNTFVLLNNTFIPTRLGSTPWTILDKGTYELQEGASITPITFYHAIHTINGVPYMRPGVGHGWTSVSYSENGFYQPLMTASLFNEIDFDNEPNLDTGDFTNIATYTNLYINHPRDWSRALAMLNKKPISDGPSRVRLNEITPEQAKELLLMRAWYLPRYSTQEYYRKYLETSIANTDSIVNKIVLRYEIAHVTIQDLLNKTFWGAMQAAMSQTDKDTRYNSITSNCVSYSTELWNNQNRNPNYDSRILKYIAVPGKLYKVMNPEEVITLPDADDVESEVQTTSTN